MHYQGIDIASLDPVLRMSVADALYDSALAEIEAASSHLSPQQITEIDRRIADANACRAMLRAEASKCPA